jgi:hypothetical protein
MNFLEVRTILLMSILINLIGLFMIFIIWIQNRHRFNGIGFWFFDFTFQAVTFALIALRDIVPDWLSIVLANSLSMIGILLGLMALNRFYDIRKKHIFNILLY